MCVACTTVWYVLWNGMCLENCKNAATNIEISLCGGRTRASPRRVRISGGLLAIKRHAILHILKADTTQSCLESQRWIELFDAKGQLSWRWWACRLPFQTPNYWWEENTEMTAFHACCGDPIRLSQRNKCQPTNCYIVWATESESALTQSPNVFERAEERTNAKREFHCNSQLILFNLFIFVWVDLKEASRLLLWHSS